MLYRVLLPNGWTDLETLAAAEAWRDANAPGATIQPIEIPAPEPERFRVSKDTMLSRVEQAGMISAVMAAVSNTPPETQFLWTNYAWFWNDNPQLVGMCQALGLDSAVILAPDEYL